MRFAIDSKERMDFTDASPSAPHRQPSSKTETEPQRHGRWTWGVALVAALLITAFVIHRHTLKKRAATAAQEAVTEPVPVAIATAHLGDMGVYLSAIGTVTPVYTASITSQVTGKIQAVHYNEGKTVHKGDPLIDLDPAPYAALLAEAKGTLQRDQNVLAQAQMDLARYRQAWSRNGISRQQLEDQEKAVLQYQGTVSYDQGAVQYAEVQLRYCHITAPIDGTIGLRLVDPGNLVTANATTSLLVITQMHPITVIFTLAEDNLQQVLTPMSRGQKLVVDVSDRGKDQVLARGTLETIDNQIDTTTGTVKLRARFENADSKLFPNEFVNTRLLVTTLHDQTLIPSSAIQHNGDKAFVYLHQGDKVVIRNIEILQLDHGNAAVQGLQSGDVVANSSFEKLQNGTSVVVAKQAAVATPSANATSAAR